MYIFDKLKDKNKIIFGPFVGEFGWEIAKWAGYVRHYILANKDKQFVVSTRKDNIDLYYNLNILIEEFEISDSTFGYSDCYRYTNENIKKQILKKLTEKYPDYYIVDPTKFECNKKVFSKSDYNYLFEIREENNSIIFNIFNENDKIVSCFPRYRETSSKHINNRNWPYWENLYQTISEDNKFKLIVIGKSPYFFRPKKKYKNIIILEDYLTEKNNLVGLAMAALTHSDLCIGSQSAGILLSNILLTPTLFWGDNPKRVYEDNVFNTKSIGLLSKSYDILSNEVYKNIEGVLL